MRELRPPRARLHVSVRTPKQKLQQLMSHRLLNRLSLYHLVMQALVMKTLVSSQSTSSVSRTLLIRMTDPYRRQLNPSRLPSVAWTMLCVAASLVHLMSQMNHRQAKALEVARLGR
uniref:Uncharacterized protein n=1 Tax=Peronospora matthiolae TaxID=2874970 RepID=A0AAV1V3B0_9STRA